VCEAPYGGVDGTYRGDVMVADTGEGLFAGDEVYACMGSGERPEGVMGPECSRGVYVW
jgi:hypothetical protein